MSKVKRPGGIEAQKRRYGRLLVLPWEIGLVLFFIVPIFTSLLYSVSQVNWTNEGITTKFIGISYYIDLFTKDANYLNNLKDSLIDIAYSVPITIALSLIFAVILNQNFRGRIVARAIFFLPVIIASGVVMSLLMREDMGVPLFTVTGEGSQNAYGSLIDFEKILEGLELPADLTKFFSDCIGNVFNLVWGCGVQTVLLIAGLQTIPVQLYEVSKVEGASKWEEFWFITVPMLGNVLLLVLVFTLIELFTSMTNPMMQQAYAVLLQQQIYDRSSAMLWTYFLVVGLVMGAVFWLYKKLCLDRWN